MIQPWITGYRCMVDDRVFREDHPYTCPEHPEAGILDLEYDREAVAAAWKRDPLAGRATVLWRYRELLPLADLSTVPPVPVGWTPLWESPPLAASLGIARAWIKDDGRGPTGSLKDRASAVGVARAVAEGSTRIACASTGNAASSLAGAAAAAGLPATIFVPECSPKPKVAQLMIFGATVFRVAGTYDDAYDLCQQAASRFGWTNRNCAFNPVLVEGKKTAGLEIAEALEENLPDWVAVSVGDGCTAAGVAKGLLEYCAVRGVSRVPRVLGVQAAGAQPLLRVFESGEDLVPVAVDTVADSIAVGHPRNWRKAVRYLHAVSGHMLAVEDTAIEEAMRDLPRIGGCFAEPAAAASLAGLREACARGVVKPRETAVVLSTGNGLKDVDAAVRAGGEPHHIPPDLDRVVGIIDTSRA